MNRRRSITGMLSLSLLACRTPPDDLVGDWVGTLDCTQDELAYPTTVGLELTEPDQGRHPGTLALEATWTGSDGAVKRQRSTWAVTLRQEFPRGAQEVDFIRADCEDAVRLEDEQRVAEGCEAVGGGIGTNSLAWDGADALSWSGSCVGGLTRGGAITQETGDPGGDPR